MGRAVTFSDLRPSKNISGVHNAAITKSETQEMAAEYIWIPPGQQWIATTLPETDCYLFMIDGTCAISVADSRHRFPTQAFAVVQEGIEFRIENDSGAPASIVKVIAPPESNGRGTPGFTGKLAVTQRAAAPIVNLPEEKKKRIYFVDDDAIRSQRGHLTAFTKALTKRIHKMDVHLWRSGLQNPNNRHGGLLLRASRERPCCHCTAEKFNELAPPHRRPKLGTGDCTGSDSPAGRGH